jgi:ubiquinone/menaquinone biosynthesis C-methylase UbiE
LKFTGERLVPKDKICGPETEIFKEHIERYEFACKFIKNKENVLDIACGVGYGTLLIAKNTSGHVYGCDVSNDAIDYARQNYEAKNVTFEVMDATSLSFPEKYFDCVVSFETLEHLTNYDKAIMEFSRVLKDKGILIISSPNKEVTFRHETNNEFHVNEFTREEFLKTLSKYFKTTKLYSQKLIIASSHKEKILKFGLSLGFKITKYDRINLRRKLLKEGTGKKLYKSVDYSYHEPNIIPYESNHVPQNFVAVCTEKINQR